MNIIRLMKLAFLEAQEFRLYSLACRSYQKANFYYYNNLLCFVNTFNTRFKDYILNETESS
jgi:hypothetical protein